MNMFCLPGNIKSYTFGLAIMAFSFAAARSLAQQDVSFGQLSVNDGLSQNSAISIAQDGDGFLWIATQDGLNRYDGKEFTIYNKNFIDITQEHKMRLGKVLARENDEIWILPISEMPERLHPPSDTFEVFRNVTQANCLYEDSRGVLWLGTLDGKVYSFSDSLGRFELHQQFRNEPVASITEIALGKLLIIQNQAVFLNNIETGTYEKYSFPEKDIYFSNALPIDSLGVWVGTLNRGLYFIPGGEKKATRWNTGEESWDRILSQITILDMEKSASGEVWLASYGNGGFIIHPKTKEIKNYSFNKQNPRSLHYNDVLCLFEDAAGVMWLGTDGSGLSFYDKYLDKFNFFHNQQVPENINIDVVRSILVDHNDHLWVGTSGKGLSEYNPDTDSWATHKPGSSLALKSPRIMSLHEDEEGRLWIGYQEGGLGILDLDTRQLRHFNEESTPALSAHTISRIFTDREKRHWLATRNEGLIQFDLEEGELKKYIHDPTNPKSIPSNNIRTLVEGNRGILWVGTEHSGIARFHVDKGTFYRYKEKDGLIPSDHIKSLYWEDQTLWIGTNGDGLGRLDLNRMTPTALTTKNGLVNDVIYGILPDSLGHLWLSSNQGISKLKVSDTDSLRFSITNFSNYAGTSSEFNTGAYFKDKNGTLYFGSLEGVYWFRGKDIQLNPNPPPTALVELRVFNKAINLKDNLRLGHKQNTLTFELASLGFSAPQKNEYKHKLEPLDEEWIYAGNNPRARYTNLAPGSYTFSAVSSNYDGVWSEEPVVFTFTIAPAWYQTSYAYLFFLVLAVGIGLSVYRFLKWRWFLRVKLRLKEREADRLKEVNTFKSKVFTGISHEFRTPLTLISGPADRLLENSNNPVIKSQLNRIKRNTNRLLDLVDQLLEVSKIQSGRQVLSVQKGNLGLLLRITVAQYFHMAQEKNIRIATEIPVMTEVWFDSQKLSQIISNLLQNAIKYGEEGSTIFFKSRLSEGQCHIRIENESKLDYDHNETDRLLEAFHQKDQNYSGFGIGMSLVKDYVELCKGEMEINYSQKARFTVYLHLPVHQYDFHPNEIQKELKVSEINLPKTHHQNSSKSELPKILIIDDNKDIRSFLSEELENNFEIIFATNGKEGLFEARQIIPDLIVSDIVMPGIDGIKLCQTLKSEDATSHIPILLISGKSDEEFQMKAIAAGADDFFQKPISPASLILRIQKLIELRVQLRLRYTQGEKISPKDLSLNDYDESFLEKVQEILREKLVRDDFTTKKFCKALGMSRMQLHRKLKALTGLSTSAFIRDQRLQLAVKQLEQDEVSVSEVAYAVGFSSPSYFNKCFKETYDMTPREYQKQKIDRIDK